MPLRRRNESLSVVEHREHSNFTPTFMYPNVSAYRSLQMDLFIYSPSVMDATIPGQKAIPVFGDNDQVGGKVILDPTCSHSGRLSVSIEGAFIYSTPENDDNDSAQDSYPQPSQKKHVFFSASTMIPVADNAALAFPGPPRSSSRSAFREAFVKRRPSYASLNTPSSPVSPARGDRSYPFSFDLPRGTRSREEIPPTFSTAKNASDTSSHTYAVEYKMLVSWEPSDSSEPSNMEIPFLLLPDADFQSFDGVATAQESWLEMPLHADRPMPFKCAVTLPTSVTFSRFSSIPYFVVFTTTPRSSSLAREIAADATVSVSIQRQVSVMEQATLPPSPPQTPSGSSEEGGSGGDFSKVNLFKRVAAPLMPRSARSPCEAYEIREKPLPRLPTQTVFSDTCTLQTSMCIGFPKRPRQQSEGKNHPSLDTQSSLPDGLLKTKMLLDRQMLPSIDWAGLSVKYYFDVSVLVGQEDLRARIPIRII